MKKIKSETAAELAWQYAEQGAALGAIYPHVVRKMFQRAHATIPKEKWERAHAAGLDIPPQQDLMSYEDVEEGEDEVLPSLRMPIFNTGDFLHFRFRCLSFSSSSAPVSKLVDDFLGEGADSEVGGRDRMSPLWSGKEECGCSGSSDGMVEVLFLVPARDLEGSWRLFSLLWMPLLSASACKVKC